jgi:hypothetical protein
LSKKSGNLEFLLVVLELLLPVLDFFWGGISGTLVVLKLLLVVLELLLVVLE